MIHLLVVLSSHVLRVHLLWLHVHRLRCAQLAVVVLRLGLLLRLWRLLRLVLLWMVLAPLGLLLLALPSLGVDFLVALLQCVLPLCSLHILVLHRVYRRDPQLKL